VLSQTLAPILEEAKSGAAEEELAGRAGSLVNEAILVAEQRRARSKIDEARTAYDCVLLGFGLGRTVNPATAAGLRGCLETAARQDPSNPDIWMALANVVRQQRVWGWGLPPGEASIERRGALADRQLQRLCAPWTSRLMTTARKRRWRMAITPSAN
jgi:hypothetical protein